MSNLKNILPVERILKRYLLLDWSEFEDLFFMFVDVTGKEPEARKQIAERDAALDLKKSDMVSIDIVASFDGLDVQAEGLPYGQKFRVVSWEELLAYDDCGRKW